MIISKPHLCYNTNMKICKVNDCTNVHYGLGFCNKHWRRFRTKGDTEGYLHGARYEHGKTGTSEYYSWGNMLKRVLSPNNPAYKWYGARGITVCERWRKFENFYADMGDKPTPKHSIERVNNNGDYEPSNCVWATKETQARNKRSPRNNTLGYKGVSYRRGSYWARLIIGDRTYTRAAKSLDGAIQKRRELEKEFWT